jgi:hypothetical protein
VKISIYGPHPDGQAIAELLKHLPEDSAEATIQAPPRRDIDLRPCMRPGVLEYAMSVDNKVFVHLSQRTETSNYEVKVT